MMTPKELPQKPLYSDPYKPLTPGGSPGLPNSAVQRLIAPELKGRGFGHYLGDAVKTTLPGLAVAFLAGLVALYFFNKKQDNTSDAENEFEPDVEEEFETSEY